MQYDVKLPDIGEGVAEGEIVRWLVSAGDSVTEEQPLVEVMTDKASVEIPSPRTGTISAIHVAEGAVVPVGTVIVSIAIGNAATTAASASGVTQSLAHGGASTPAAAAAGAAAEASASAIVVPAASVTATAAPRVQAAPAVRALAKQLGVALETLAGSGPGGTITGDDVKRAASPGASPEPARSPRADEPEERIALRGLRRKIAEHMRRSVATTAAFTFVAECDFTAVIEHRERARPEALASGTKLTFLPYVFCAVIEPLRRYPLLNSSREDATHEIVLKRFYHLGLATSTDDGLTVPILHHADRLGLFAVARELERLAQAARARKLEVEDLHGGTFTITSTGAHGGVLATPILHHPQVAILGVHEVKKRPAVVNDQIVIRSLGNLSLSLDHRVVDGAVGADFLYAVIERLQSPEPWLGDLRRVDTE